MNILQQITSIDDKKQFIGNQIYPNIEAAVPGAGGKITGMLLDESVVNLD